MKEFKIDTKNLEEAYKKAEEELKVLRDKIKFEVVEEKKLLSKIYHVTATVEEDYPLKGLHYLKSVLELLGVNAVVEMRKKSNKEVRYVITSEENSILIGKGGKTLESLQILLRTIVNKNIDSKEEQFTVSLDCGNYKMEHNKRLEILATKIAKGVAQSKVEAHLDPMNSYERRVIHAKLADWRDVYTESMGEGKDRHIVIKPRQAK